MLTAE
ncbi:hypothetical protein A2U01_0099010, partial [Trifolium medium]